MATINSQNQIDSGLISVYNSIIVNPTEEIEMHELEMVNNEAQMAFTGPREDVWHRLGKQVSNDLTPQQMMEAAGVDWHVSKQPLYMRLDNGTEVQTKQMALVRDSDGKILDYVSPSWNPVQNEEAFNFFNDFVGSGKMKMDTAGSLKGGQIVWANAKLGDEFDIFGGDVVKGYMLFSNPHKFGQGINIRTCMTRTVCWNTLSVGLRENSKHAFSQSHATKFDAEKVKEAMGVSKQFLAKYKEQALFLGSKIATVDQMIDYFKTVFPVNATEGREQRSEVSRNAELAMSVLETQPGAQFAKGSWWQAFNSVTYLTDNLIGRTDENRTLSGIYGVNAAKKSFALNKALQMATLG